MKKKLLLLATCLFSVLMANAESWKTLFFEDFGDVADWPVEKHYENMFFFQDGDPSGFSPWGSSWGRSWNCFPLGRSKNETGGTFAHIKTPTDYYAWPDGSRKPCDTYGTYMPNYVMGGDHTCPYDYDKGCFVYAQMPLPSIPNNYALGPLFHKTIDISNMHNTTVRASAWIANFSTTKDVDVWMYAVASTKDGQQFVKYGSNSEFKLKNARLSSNIRTYEWVCNTCTYELNGDYKWDKLVFIIEYRTKKNCYWGLGIDDIKIEFDQSTAGVAFAFSKTVQGRNVTIKPDITLKRLQEILGTNNGNFYYEWSKCEKNMYDVYKTIGGGRITSDADLQMNFSYFDPDTHNGTWKLKIWNNVTSVERCIYLDLKDSDLVRTRTRGVRFDDEEEVNYDEAQKPNIYNDGSNLYVNGTSENSQIIVYDMSGNAVAYSTTSPVNISVLKKGVYVVDINGTKVKFMKK
ncbi:MAG: T9SS type A sorting domain-containing protein [Paludibacteraceae bacterium]|nr:T9SS type A sorting domain-containing protein [Paludibacteraceae bacterium]